MEPPEGDGKTRMEIIKPQKAPNNASLQASTRRRKRKRSGKRFAHQVGRRMQLQICLALHSVCGCSPDAVPGVGS